MISVRIKSKSYEGAPVLGDVSFDIAQGECLAILGLSGVGKSTLLRIAAGLDKQFDGSVTCPPEKAMVFQEPTLLPWRSAADNVAIFHPHLSAGEVETALTRVGLEGRGAAFPGQLSLGQQRRLSLARAFAGRPKALFLDEPFVSLDTDTADEMMSLTEQLLADLRPAVLFVTHNQNEANRLATRRSTLSGAPAILGG